MAEWTCVPWDDVISRLDWIVAQAPEPFDQDTIDNGRELIHYLREHFAPPDAFDKGYWSTFSLVWDNFEIEVFGERFEIYRFFEGATDILHFSHRPGETFTPEFLAQLRMPPLRDSPPAP